MPIHNSDVAKIFNKVADMLDIEGANQFRVRAMDNPHFHILGHPTGRLIQERDPYEMDIEQILKGAQEMEYWNNGTLNIRHQKQSFALDYFLICIPHIKTDFIPSNPTLQYSITPTLH